VARARPCRSTRVECLSDLVLRLSARPYHHCESFQVVLVLLETALTQRQADKQWGRHWL